MNFQITDTSECPKAFHAEKVVGYDWECNDYGDCQYDNQRISNFTNFGICDENFQRKTQQNLQNWLDLEKAKANGLWVWEPKEYVL